MKTEKEIRDEVRNVRERAKNLSGFWIPELAAAAYALEWALEKRPDPPSNDIGSPASAHGRLAESFVKAAGQAASVGLKPRPPKKPAHALARVRRPA